MIVQVVAYRPVDDDDEGRKRDDNGQGQGSDVAVVVEGGREEGQ